MKRPIKFKLDSYRNYLNGASPVVAFEQASSQNGGVKLSGCMTTRAYASGYMSDDIKNWIRRAIKAQNPEVLAYFDQHGLSLDF